MELLMKNIHMYRQAKEARMEVTLDEDVNVPDAKPDVEMIIQNKERVVLEDIRTESGRIYLHGFMEVGVLYLDDTKERQLHRLDTRLPFDETLFMEGLEPGETVRICHETEDLSTALINSRKLAIRGLLSFRACVNEIYDLSAGVEARTETVLCEKKKKLELMQLEVQKKDIIRIREELSLPSNKPDIREVLWENIRLQGCRIRLEDGKLLTEGTLFVFVLYRGEGEENPCQWLEQTLPVKGELECAGCRKDMVPDIEVSFSQAELQPREDADGELRAFHLEGILDLEISLYGSEETEILEDVFSPEKELEVTAQEETYESLVMHNESRCKAEGKIRIQAAKPRILQICHSHGSVKIDQTKIVPGGIRIEGAVPASILYISPEDNMPFAVMEGILPFTHVAEIPGVTEDCRFSIRAGLEQLQAAMADSEEIELRASLNLELFVVRPHSQRCIREIQEKEYDPAVLEKVPAITGYVVQKGDTLWEIAKEYCMTPRQIAEANGLENGTLTPGAYLILMKNLVTFHENQG